MTRRAAALQTVSVDVPESAVGAYEAALRTCCDAVGLFPDARSGLWRVEGVTEVAGADGKLSLALALAAAATGVSAALERHETAADGWLARARAAFPEQNIGRFAIRGTHLARRAAPGRITLIVDAGAAFGSGEHGSTRGCLRALERIAHRRPRRIIDMGTGSGILAMAAARLLRQKVLATDIDPWAVRVAAKNAAINGLASLVRPTLADGWRRRAVRSGGPYDLVLANILARPLAAMGRDLARSLAPGGTAILSGLLSRQAPMVLAAHRRLGLCLDFALREGEWTTLVLRKRAQPSQFGAKRLAFCKSAHEAAQTKGTSARVRPMSASSRSES
jgi:ribosomal protein L11 methyltransferase